MKQDVLDLIRDGLMKVYISSLSNFSQKDNTSVGVHQKQENGETGMREKKKKTSPKREKHDKVLVSFQRIREERRRREFEKKRQREEEKRKRREEERRKRKEAEKQKKLSDKDIKIKVIICCTRIS